MTAATTRLYVSRTTTMPLVALLAALCFGCVLLPSAHAIDETPPPPPRRSSHILPNWATEEELLLQPQQEQQQQQNTSSSSIRLGAPKFPFPLPGQMKQVVTPQQNVDSTTPTPPLFRMPAEHEPVSMIIMAWDPFFSNMLTRMAELVVAAGAEVQMMIHTYDYYTSPRLMNMNGLNPLHVNYNSLWTRDYGPVVGIKQDNTANSVNTLESGILDSRRLEVIDATYRLYWSRPYDNDVPCQLASTQPVAFSMQSSLPCRSTRLILDGGNLMFDGKGALFTTLATYHWNVHQGLNEAQVDERLQQTFGVDTVHVLDYARRGTQAADGTGHIDMFAKILAPCVVIVAQTTDRQSIFFDPINQAAAYFYNLQCDASPTGKYQVYRVPGWDNRGTWFTYTNSLTVGDTVIVPSFGYYSNLDEQARAVYNQAAPHLKVEFVNADEIIHYGGAVHCLTRQVPALLAESTKTVVASAEKSPPPPIVIP